MLHLSGIKTHCAASSPQNTFQRPGTPRRLSAYCLLLFACLTFPFLGGCGGATAFDGGGFPIGGTRLFGRVVSAENPNVVISGANIRVNATYTRTRAVDSQEVTTNADGTFNFDKVLTGDVSGTVEVVIEPGASSGRQSQQVTFTLTKDRPADLIVSLPLTTTNVSLGKSLTISVPRQTIPTYDAITVAAQVLDAKGNPLPLTPTLLLDGDTGTLAPTGIFSGTQVGSATVTAFWYNALKTTPLQISVSNSTQSLPPAPPGGISAQSPNGNKSSEADLETVPANPNLAKPR